MRQIAGTPTCAARLFTVVLRRDNATLAGYIEMYTLAADEHCAGKDTTTLGSPGLCSASFWHIVLQWTIHLLRAHILVSVIMQM
jgi:hypothetical protein